MLQSIYTYELSYIITHEITIQSDRYLQISQNILFRSQDSFLKLRPLNGDKDECRRKLLTQN
jgi:hypothetical protein